MNMHHITKSLFVGAAIAGIGMSSGRAEITFDEEFRESVKVIVRKALRKKYEAFNAVFPETLSDIQLEQDTNTVCDSLFDCNTGFAHFFTDDFSKSHRTIYFVTKLYQNPEELVKNWLGLNIFFAGGSRTFFPDDVRYNGRTTLHIRTALASRIERIKQIEATEVSAGTLQGCYLDNDEVKALRRNGLMYILWNDGCIGGLWNDGCCTGECGPYDLCLCYLEKYHICFDDVILSITSEMTTFWYSYVLAHLSEGQEAHYEVAQMLNFCPFPGNFCKAFLVSLTKNYSRYLTIKGDLQNGKFTSDTYQMYSRFKESNERIRQMLLFEVWPSKTGESGTGMLAFLNSGSLDSLGWDMTKVWQNMVIKFGEMVSFTKFVETHPQYKKFMGIRCRRLMRIWADSDNR